MNPEVRYASETGLSVTAFRQVLDELGVEAAEAWHVGDNVKTDVAGALSAGLTAVWLNRRGARIGPNEPTPHHYIASLAELPLLLGL